MINEIQVSNKELSNDFYLSKNEVINKYTTAKLSVNDLINSTKLSDEPLSDSSYLYNLEDGEQAISISIKSLAKGLSNKIESGDII